MRDKIIKCLYLLTGLMAFVLGTIGAFIPILPTIPFYLITLFCFARSSKKMHNWFVETKLYKNNLEKIINRKEIPLKSKVKIMLMFTFVMVIAFYAMRNTNIGRIVLVIIWIGHMIFFAFGIKTKNSSQTEKILNSEIKH